MALRHGVQYATMTEKRCPMHDEVCAAAVAKRVAEFYGPGFDAMALIEARCGRFTRGAHVGKLRGWATLRVCTEGGWSRARNGVVYPGRCLGVAITDFNGKAFLAVGEDI